MIDDLLVCHRPEVYDVELEPCDVLFEAGSGWLSRQILSATREFGEEPTEVSHVGQVDKPGTILSAEILEAAGGRVRRTTIGEQYACGDHPVKIAVARPRLSAEQRRAVLNVSRSFEGQFYGFAKLPLHLLDAWVGKALRRKVSPVWFRKLSRTRWPVCSAHVGESFSVVGEFQGFDRFRSPDDLFDAVIRDRRWSWPIGPSLLPLPGLNLPE